MPTHDPVVASRKSSRKDEFVHGIPNRSLTFTEYEAMTKEQRQAVEDSGLYELHDLDAARAAYKGEPVEAVQEPVAEAKADEAPAGRRASSKKAGE